MDGINMDHNKFKDLFLSALEDAAKNAEDKFSITLPRNYLIEFHGLGRSGDLVSVETAADTLYLGEDVFFPLVDIAAKEMVQGITIIFLRISGYRPVKGIDNTWNEPDGSGPFNQIFIAKFKQKPE